MKITVLKWNETLTHETKVKNDNYNSSAEKNKKLASKKKFRNETHEIKLSKWNHSTETVKAKSISKMVQAVWKYKMRA